MSPPEAEAQAQASGAVVMAPGCDTELGSVEDFTSFLPIRSMAVLTLQPYQVNDTIQKAQ